MAQHVSSDDGRPATIAGVLDSAAEWLDSTDALVAHLMWRKGEDFDQAGQVQADLRVMASWFREHPSVDGQLREVVGAFPAVAERYHPPHIS